MFVSRFRTAALIVSTALGLSACAMDDGYGYGGVSAGYGAPYYDDGYYGAYGNNLYGGYGGGWYDDFYYPGNGYYVYDRGGKRHRWNDRQQRYWANRGDGRGNGRPGYGRPGDGRPGDGRPGDGRPGAGRPGDGRPGFQPDRGGVRPDFRPGQGRPGRPAFRQDGQGSPVARPEGRPDRGQFRPDRSPRTQGNREARPQGVARPERAAPAQRAAPRERGSTRRQRE